MFETVNVTDVLTVRVRWRGVHLWWADTTVSLVLHTAAAVHTSPQQLTGRSGRYVIS